LEWLTIIIIFILFLCFIFLFILLIIRFRHCHLRKKTNLYYKCSQLTNTTNSSSNENNPKELNKKINYDDMTSMGSYIYPITSTTSLMHTSSPSSLFKSEQYAIIDGNVKKQNFQFETFYLIFVLDISLCIIRYWTKFVEIY
jgi:hypothetical protein